MTSTLVVYSKGAVVPACTNSNETLALADKEQIARIPCTVRRLLSNFCTARLTEDFKSVPYSSFEYNGRRYPTIEHAYQAAKFLFAGHENVARRFEVIDDEVAVGWEAINAQKQRKAVVLSKDVCRAWAEVSDDRMTEMMTARFSSCPNARTLLLMTEGIQLWHAVPRKPRLRWFPLEAARAHLLAKADVADVPDAPVETLKRGLEEPEPESDSKRLRSSSGSSYDSPIVLE